ncbi:MAG: hypothetical protein ABI440_11505 [Casimicrobiaceae bacterium]
MLIAGAVAVPAFAQGTASQTQRDMQQQQRIESGLQSGSLSTHEAGALERDQAHVDRLQANALRDGTLSNGEKARIRAAQNRSSAQIAADRHNARHGNPQSKSSQRMQADVQRNVAQQARIHEGVASGALSNREASSLQRGQVRVARSESAAAANGRVGAVEEARVQGRENVQSARIHRDKHD